MHSTNINHAFGTAKKTGKKQFAVLIDPDKVNSKVTKQLAVLATEAEVDYFFIGGSLVVNNSTDACIQVLKEYADIPTVLFPGHPVQLSFQADAILFLALISGRNPDLLIGQHVIAAPLLKKSDLEVIPTGYMLIDGGAPTSVSYMSNTTPIPNNKPDIAVCTALAGEMLGQQLIYMDAGSGASLAISEEMIKAVSEAISIPLVVGGGIRCGESAYEAVAAGADIVVVGNAIEKKPTLLKEISAAIHSYGTSRVMPHVPLSNAR